MIATNKTLLKNYFLIAEAKNLKESKFITSGQFKNIKEQFPALKTHDNILIRIGFLILGVFLYSSICGLISLFTYSLFDSEYEKIAYLFAIIGFIVSEFLASQNYFRFGLDDAFILGFQICLYFAIGVNSESMISVFIAMAIIGLLSAIRYINAISALFCLIGVVGIISKPVMDYGIIEPMFLPFIMLLLALILYIVYSKLAKNPKAHYYESPFQILQVFSLFLGYSSINYLVVREFSREFMGIYLNGNQDIPFSFLFYGLTFLVPLFYIGFSLYKKNRTMLIIGFITLALSFGSIRYYYSLMPAENALILAGILLSGLAYLAIKKIRDKEAGITFKADKNNNPDALSYAQAVIINSQLNIKTSQPEESKMPFGGGGFSGGGSDGSF